MPRKPAKKGGDPLIGAVVERRWQILDQLGAGGMGVVYRAERVGLGKQVALKFLHSSVAESKAAVARFEREAKAISRLHHIHCISKRATAAFDSATDECKNFKIGRAHV